MVNTGRIVTKYPNPRAVPLGHGNDIQIKPSYTSMGARYLFQQKDWCTGVLIPAEGLSKSVQIAFDPL